MSHLRCQNLLVEPGIQKYGVGAGKVNTQVLMSPGIFRRLDQSLIGLTQFRRVCVASALRRRKPHTHRIYHTGMQGPGGVEFIEVPEEIQHSHMRDPQKNCILLMN